MQISTGYYYGSNRNIEKAMYKHKVRDLPEALQNSSNFEPNYSDYRLKRKPPAHKSKSFILSMQPTQSYCNTPLVKYKIQTITLPHDRHKYLAGFVVSWITIPDL